MITLLAAAVLALDAAQPPSLAQLHETVLHTTEPAERAQALETLAATPPTTLQDLRRLFDLFMRYPEPAVRNPVMSSLERLTPASARALEMGFVEFLKVPEHEARLFGLRGLARLRSAAGSTLISELARAKFRKSSPEELELPSERDQWWITYEALNTLAAVAPAKARRLVASQAEKAPMVARIYAQHYWEDVLPKLAKWKPEQRGHALKANLSEEVVRKTRPKMLALVRDPKAPEDLRHRLAILVGLSSKPEEVAELLKEHEAGKDLYILAALYASRDPQTVPLVRTVALQDPDPRRRMGSLVHLEDMLPPADFKALLIEAEKTDSDPENKEEIARLLKQR